MASRGPSKNSAAKNIQTFSGRWTATQLARVSRDLYRGKIPQDATRVEHDGVEYVDLRGIVIPRSMSIHVQYMTHWDLCHAYLGSGWMSASAQSASHCLFAHTKLEGNIGSEFTDCNFDKARLNAGVSGTFRHCSFQGSILKRLDPRHKPSFIECDFRQALFSDCDLNGITFDTCLWEGTKISGGSANGTRWIGTRPEGHQLRRVFIMTAEEAERERQIELEVDEELRRDRQ